MCFFFTSLQSLFVFLSLNKTRKILPPGSEILLLISQQEKTNNVFLCQFCAFLHSLKLHSLLANLSHPVNLRGITISLKTLMIRSKEAKKDLHP